MMSPSLCRWQRRKEARPREIVDAALDLFVEHGFAATRLEEVAKRAGIAKGTLYRYFDSKEALFRAVVQELIIPHVVEAETTLAQYHGSYEVFLRKLIQQWWQVVGLTRLACVPKLMVSEAANCPELARFYLDNVVVRVRRLLSQIIERGIQANEFRQCDAAMMARFLMAPLVFTVIWNKSLAPFDSEQYDVNAFIELHVTQFFTALNNKQSQGA